MQLTEITYEGQPPIDAYGPNFFRVMEQVQEGPLAILPKGVIKWNGFDDLDQLIKAATEYDVIFIGTGKDIAPLPASVKTALEAVNVPFEVMGTPAACRTYNVLLSEGRRVAIAALPVSE
ncbi:hypothetical protein F9L33_05745 [Amylibacter sp. SFDW26]|uniref:Mth938-like domain-containing protein n=1 Tax=Amylibacter sp. SFDW26 TaxID=2652722 RepID=UPI001261BF40|nr:Mth938-like domain-containing protein [Amylibacter sp. SFDW26]KAB7616252.1 hypothetical protein F9L33_05745 [Amylibacter sp. SFDW26]